MTARPRGRRAAVLMTLLAALASVLLAVVGTVSVASPAGALPVPDPTGVPDPTPRPEPTPVPGDLGIMIRSGRVKVLGDGTVTLNGAPIGNLVTMWQQAPPPSTFSVTRPSAPRSQFEDGWDPALPGCYASDAVTAVFSTDPAAPTAASTTSKVWVGSPYPFDGCRVRATTMARLVLPITVTGPSRTLTACGYWDITCHSVEIQTWQIAGEYPELTALLLYFNTKPFGVWTAGRLVSSLSIELRRP